MKFRDRIKQLRMRLLLSQRDFAGLLDVSFATVNRWETGKCVPNFKARKALSEVCAKHGIGYSEYFNNIL